jgi:2-phosphosulfolactate phosphatase
VPEIRVLHLLDGARKASGLTVVIDVFRAFSVAPLAIRQGAVWIHPVATPEEALAIRVRNPDWLLMGERDGRPLPGFDFGNSPAEIVAVNLSGRILVQRTSAGVQGLLAAGASTGAGEILTGSFINARAVVDYVRAVQPAVVSLVVMGWNGTEDTLEDILCAEYLATGIRTGTLPPMEGIRERLREDSSGAKFFDPEQPWFRAADFGLCLRSSIVDRVLRLEASPDGSRILVPRSVPGVT